MSKKNLVIVLLILAVDIVSKYLAMHYINPIAPIHVFDQFLGIDFSLTYTTNRGAAWGILADYQAPLMAFRCLMVGAILVYTFFLNKRAELTAPLLIIATGAFGNILDYYLYGEVIDMFHFTFWGYNYPVFNIADSAIFIGIIWIFFLSWKK